MTPRGSALQKRLRDREKEMEADERDRKREKEELEEIRQRLLEEGHPNPDAELRRVCSSALISVSARVCLPSTSVRSGPAVCCLCEGHLIPLHLMTLFSEKLRDLFLIGISASYWSRWKRKRRSV